MIHYKSTLWRSRFALAVILFAAGMITAAINTSTVLAQEEEQWSSQKRIFGFDPETETPVLVADPSGTVHAFSSQWLSEEDGQGAKAIMYNQWSIDNGWTMPLDIILSPLKNEARMQDAFLDQNGVMHIVFFGGDETDGNIYYSRAPVNKAGMAPSWSSPVVVGEVANDPSLAAMSGDDQGNLVVVYSGKKVGKGLYSVSSSDSGVTWTKPEPSFLTYGTHFPFILELGSGQSGQIHSVWDVRDQSGNGRMILYAQLDPNNGQWSKPVVVAEAESGYGILNPSVIEHNGELFVAYSGLVIRRSNDGGQTWTEEERPFHLTGINGKLTFFVDSSDTLNLIWAQRRTGSPDIHGVWHSTWQDGSWSEPKPVFTGPRIYDDSGDKGFDPYDVLAVVVHGNTVLATWRTDPGGIKPNGVWYSVGHLDAPYVAGTGLALNAEGAPAPIPDPVTAATPIPEPTPMPGPQFSEQDNEKIASPFFGNNPAQRVFITLIPTVALVVLIIFVRSYLILQRQ